MLVLLLLVSSAIAAPNVHMGNTTVIGRYLPVQHQDFFGGIPYAEPPIGKLRLQLPVAKGPLNGTVFEATDFGPACLQAVIPSSEDCLTLNILRPTGVASNASLPVMAWLHGGGFFSGASSQFNGSNLVSQSVARGTPIIYVNFNYRLGPLGFPQGQEAVNRGALNLGLKDQLVALEWIQENIGLFGGDKRKVVVFGESAGAVSIGVFFLNPSFGKLARAAIFQSGTAASSITFNASHRQPDWQDFVASVPECEAVSKSNETFGCLQGSNSSALLQASSKALSETQEQYVWLPTLDGEGGLLPDFPSKFYSKGHFARIPFISGSNLDEGTIFTSQLIDSAAAVRADVIANYTPSFVGSPPLEAAVDTIMELYSGDPALESPYNTGNQTFGLSPEYKRSAAITGDLMFHALRRLWTQSASKAGVKLYGYLLTDPQQATPPALGVAHESDIPYVYGDLPPAQSIASSLELSRMMMDYWLSFATSLDPNDGLGVKRPEWPQYICDKEVLLQLDGRNTTVIPDTYRAPQIEFINNNSLIFHH